MAKYIDADALKGELQRKVFGNYTDEFWGTMQVIDEMPGIEYPPTKSSNCIAEWDDYMKGWEADGKICLDAISEGGEDYA